MQLPRIVDLLRESFGVRVIAKGRNVGVPDHERFEVEAPVGHEN